MKYVAYLLNALLFLNIIMPNLQVIDSRIIIHDYISLSVFILSLSFLKLDRRDYFFLLAYTWCVVLYYLLNNTVNGYLILLRQAVYLIPVLIIVKNKKILSCVEPRCVKLISIVLLACYCIAQELQRELLIMNIFQVDYYYRSLGISIESARFGWYDEHFSATPVLIFLGMCLLGRNSHFLNIFFAIYNGSRMMISGIIASVCLGIKNIYIKIFLSCLICGVIILMPFTDFYRDFDDLQLRLNNWRYYLSLIQTPSDLLLGLDIKSKITVFYLDGVRELPPIDNFIVRLLVGVGLVGFILFCSIIMVVYFNINSTAKNFLIIFTFSSIFNDLYSYPPCLGGFVGAVSLLSIYIKPVPA